MKASYPVVMYFIVYEQEQNAKANDIGGSCDGFYNTAHIPDFSPVRGGNVGTRITLIVKRQRTRLVAKQIILLQGSLPSLQCKVHRYKASWQDTKDVHCPLPNTLPY